MARAFGAWIDRMCWGRVAISARPARPLKDLDGAPDRIRGALGAALRDRATHRDAAALHRVLFGGGGGETRPPPFTLHTDAADAADDLRVTLNLFGAAANYLVAAAEGLDLALRGGIRSGPDSPARITFTCAAPVFGRRSGFPAPTPPRPTGLRLRLRTPLYLGRSDGTVHGSIDALPEAIAHRMGLLAADWTTAPPMPPAPLRLSEHLRIEEHSIRPVPFERWSQSHPHPIRKVMFSGEAVFSGDPTPFLPLLAFAAVFHAGKMTAHGPGRIGWVAT